jgi:hypothetical protein
MNETGKTTLQEIQRYFVAFWSNYQRINSQILRLSDGEKEDPPAFVQIRDAIQRKVERHLEDTFGSLEDSNGRFPL